MAKLTVINPATDKEIATYETISFAEVRKQLERADARSREWRTTSFKHRASLLKKAAARLRENAEEYSKLITTEMGKPMEEAKSEVEKCAWVCEYYAKQAPRFLLDERIKTDAKKSYVRYNPLGVVLAVMPWNYPFWQVFRFAAPALMAGNAGILKHASNVPGCALAIEEIFNTAGFPEGLFKSLLVESKMVKRIIRHPLVQAVTLTGSEGAGAAVAAEAGKQIKKSVLELGGSDPYLILEDADLDHAAKVCAQSRLLNSGQSCIGAKRHKHCRPL
ncbi:MAG: aldehyde dehydrogenase family protein [Bacteroidota bacterium]